MTIENSTQTRGPDSGGEALLLADEEIVRRVLAGETDSFDILLRRHNQRVYRAVRAVLRDDAEAEDVTQEAWVRAFSHLDQFESRSRFATWLTRIAVYEAWARARRRRRVDPMDDREGSEMTMSSGIRDPEMQASNGELRASLESAIEALPDPYRLVFVLREVEQLSTAETAESLEVSEETVRTRLHRARAHLRRQLLAKIGPTMTLAFPFLGARCDRMTRNVMARVRAVPPPRPGSIPADTSE